MSCFIYFLFHVKINSEIAKMWSCIWTLFLPKSNDFKTQVMVAETLVGQCKSCAFGISDLQLGWSWETLRPACAAVPHHAVAVGGNPDLQGLLERRRLSVGHHRSFGRLQDEAGTGTRTADFREVRHSQVKIRLNQQVSLFNLAKRFTIVHCYHPGLIVGHHWTWIELRR